MMVHMAQLSELLWNSSSGGMELFSALQETTRDLIGSGADPNATNEDGEKPGEA